MTYPPGRAPVPNDDPGCHCHLNLEPGPSPAGAVIVHGAFAYEHLSIGTQKDHL